MIPCYLITFIIFSFLYDFCSLSIEVIMKKFKIGIVKFLVLGVAMLMLSMSNLSAQVSVTLPTVVGAPGSTTLAPITVGDLTGQNVTSFQFTLTYDNTVIEVTGVDIANTMIAGNPPTINVDDANGRILVAWASATALSGAGVLLNLNITFEAIGTTALATGATFLFNAGAPAAVVTAGSATVPSISIVAGDVTANVGDAIVIPITTTALVAGDNILAYNFSATFDPAQISITTVDLASTLSDGGSVQINADNTLGTVNIAWAKATAITGDGLLLNVLATVLGKGTGTFAFTGFQFNAGAPVAGTFDGTITVGNLAPSFTAVADQTVNEGETMTFTVAATDPDGDALVYSATALPTGATFNVATQVFTWTPSMTDAGSYTAGFSVTDGNGGTDALSVNITVTDVNRAPTLTLTPAGPYIINEGNAFGITLVGADMDTDNTITYSGTDLPTGSALNATTGAFTWTPGYSDAGSYAVTFTVTDSHSAATSVAATISVINVNRAPEFTTTMPDQQVTVHVAPNPVAFTFQYAATDPDGDVVTYILEAAPDGASITADGLFTWVPTTTQAEKSFVVIVKITDGTLNTFHQATLTTSAIVGIVEQLGIPEDFELNQNYPNPFNPTTTLRFGLPEESHVVLKIYSILGKEVATVVNDMLSAGFHEYNFDASNLSTGTYIYRFVAKDYLETKKMVLIK